jgi:hypothetical protein
VTVGGEVTSVGITRSNILSVSAGAEFAADLVEARLREELRAAAHKTARTDVDSDLVLLQQLLASQRKGFANTVRLTNQSEVLSAAAIANCAPAQAGTCHK